jgi:hypothetical protein
LQIEDNMGALKVVPKLTPEVLDEIDAIMANKPEAPATFK